MISNKKINNLCNLYNLQKYFIYKYLNKLAFDY